MLFRNQVAIVTGSTRGIGKEIAQSFAKEGAHVIIIGRNGDLANQTRDDLLNSGLSAECYCCDVTNMENSQEIVNKILDKQKCVDILVNNAGITKDNLLLRMSENDWDEVINVNLKGCFIWTKLISKVMLKAKKGKIINISSVIGINGNIGQSNYAASKAGIIGFTKSVAREFASRGITVNAVAPGYILTDLTAQLKDEKQREILQTIPMQKFGKVEDISNACLFLASKAANYITGQTIVVDGGMAI